MDEEIGERLRKAREAAGLSLSEMTRRTSYSRGYLSNIENGSRRATPEVVVAYKRAFGHDVNRRSFLTVAGIVLADVAPRHVGLRDVDEMREMFARLRDLDNHLGGADTYRLYSSELARTEHALDHSHYNSSTRDALASLAAEQAQQAGWAAFDAGHTEPALRLYRYSRYAAVEGKSDDLAANALIHISYAAATPHSVDAADAACGGSSTASARTRALLESRRAWSLAATGDADGASRALDQARDALGDADGAPSPHWSGWMDSTELDLMAGRVWCVLRDFCRAVPALETALATYPDGWARDKALYTLHLADAYLEQGQLDQATTVAMNAVCLAAPVASARPVAYAKRISRRLTDLKAPGAPHLADRLTRINPPIPASL
ncbi:MAG: helix-turn-helix transcriptional regulator [Actinobacteria bacterium]|nr:helix-turn-helix transcriptional regulator [Actinomycetota bacterium]